jgi:hypothetical protein
MKVFSSIKDAKGKLESWRLDYNTPRPHSAIGDLTASEFAERFKNLALEREFLNLEVAWGQGGQSIVFYKNPSLAQITGYKQNGKSRCFVVKK